VVKEPDGSKRFGDRWWNPAMYSALIAVVTIGGWWWGSRVDLSSDRCVRRDFCDDPGWFVLVTVPVSLLLLVVVFVSRPIRTRFRVAMAAVSAAGAVGVARGLGVTPAVAVAIAVAAVTMIPRRRPMNFGQ